MLRSVDGLAARRGEAGQPETRAVPAGDLSIRPARSVTARSSCRLHRDTSSRPTRVQRQRAFARQRSMLKAWTASASASLMKSRPLRFSASWPSRLRSTGEALCRSRTRGAACECKKAPGKAAQVVSPFSLLEPGYFLPAAGSRTRYVPVTTALSFLPGTLANALMVSAVPFTRMGAPYTSDAAVGCDPSTV